MSSEPPPSQSRPVVRPMTPIVATGWAVIATFGMMFIASLLASLREGAESDFVSNIACEALATLGTLFIILRVHAPEATIREVIGMRRTHVAFYPLGLALGAAAWLPTNVLFDAIVRRWPDPKSSSDLAELLSTAATPKRILLALLIVVVGPVLEEIL